MALRLLAYRKNALKARIQRATMPVRQKERMRSCTQIQRSTTDFGDSWRPNDGPASKNTPGKAGGVFYWMVFATASSVCRRV